MMNNKLIAPWRDFDGNEIYDGCEIRHPSGEVGRVVFLPNEEMQSDAWRVVYVDDLGKARLCLQVGDKGQAKVVK